MLLSAGTLLGPYEIQAPLGAGGMGEVYRARDTRLNRDVALKILPPIFAADPDRLARFQREAQVLASLNHPNIAAIYGLEESGGTTALVLELVPGETLADRIAKGPVSFDDAHPIARQIAEALEAAHGQGIIHRDLKPANIKITPDGLVKVLDFGLAKLAQPAGIGSPASPLSMSPTITSPVMTGVGALLGTAAYMSPEQAKGREADKRSDVWAFGCVLFEMLAGKRAFDGDEVAETMAAVIRDSPDWQRLPLATPPALHRLLRRALEKNPKRRLADIADARIEIEDAITEPDGAPTPGPAVSATRSLRGRVLAAAAVVLFLTTLGLVAWQVARRGSDIRVVRFDIPMPPSQFGTPAAEISPDGRTVAFIGPSDGKLMVWLRPMDAAAAFPLRGTEGARDRVFWSPDSTSVAFVVGGQLRRIAVAGGSPRPVANLTELSYTGSWSNQDTIILGGTQTGGGLLRVSASGGSPEPLTMVDTARHERFHTLPRFLPDGRRYLFLAVVDDGPSVTYLGTLGMSERRAVSGINAEARYVSTGHILFLRDGVLMVQRFDPDRVELAGDAVPVVDPLTRPDAITGPFSVSTDNTLVYSAAATKAVSRLAWFSRTGTELAAVAPAGVHVNPELSPDGKLVAFDEGGGPTGDVWILDLASGAMRQLTTHPANDGLAHWSPDSKRIAFRSDRDGVGNIYVRDLGSADETPLVKNGETKTLQDWSSDGEFMAYLQGGHVWAAPVSGSGTPRQVTFSPRTEFNARFSPDVRWIAYESREPSGRLTVPDDVLIQSFPDGREQIAVGRGGVPRWNHDGSELFFIAADQQLMAVPISTNGSTLRLGTAVPLFRSPSAYAVGRTYAVASDGRFLMRVPIDGQVGSPISVILNWAGKLR